jgi:hypothetical protein
MVQFIVTWDDQSEVFRRLIGSAVSGAWEPVGQLEKFHLQFKPSMTVLIEAHTRSIVTCARVKDATHPARYFASNTIPHVL